MNRCAIRLQESFDRNEYAVFLSNLEKLRCREAVRLACFFGRPALDLTLTELVTYGVAAGLIATPDDDDSDRVYVTKKKKS